MSELQLHFEDARPGCLVASFNLSLTSELTRHLMTGLEQFSIRVPRPDAVVLRWAPASLLYVPEEYEDYEHNSLRLRFTYCAGLQRQRIEYVVEAIKQRIIEIVTACGLYNIVEVRG